MRFIIACSGTQRTLRAPLAIAGTPEDLEELARQILAGARSMRECGAPAGWVDVAPVSQLRQHRRPKHWAEE